MATKRKADEETTPSRITRRKVSQAPAHGTEVITVIVGSGDAKKRYTIHKDLVAKHSDFFAAATTGDWPSAKQGKVVLKEDDPDVFDIFYHFLYSGEVYSSKAGDTRIETGDDEVEHCYDREWTRLISAWDLGDSLLSTSFKDAITDAITTKVCAGTRYPANFHKSIYPRSSSLSAIRKLCVDLALWYWVEKECPSLTFDAELAEFYFDYMQALEKTKMSGLEGKDPLAGGEPCIYHEHGRDKPCYKTMFGKNQPSDDGKNGDVIGLAGSD